jgi:signal transduction histidine kinase
LLVFRGITRRINRLAAHVDAFLPPEAADPCTRADRGKDEIGRLQASFSRMSATITRQIDELKRQDSLRRELVANVSHDLRTPLTALHNYLETLQLHADRLTAEARSDYIERAVRQSLGVARLAQQLFELARLECEESPPQAEDFCINELLQDVRHKMTFAADAAGVNLDAGAAGDRLMVRADIGLIERVLTNLIDNAVRCTPRGGFVRLDARRIGDAVEIDVADSGRGIAPERLPTLFARYSPLRRRDGDPSRGGLGLLIVHRILTLHRTTIAVDSAPDRGTRFRFVLPAAVARHA